MILSMTGFGRATTTIQNCVYNIDVKCLNSKQLDLAIRVPNSFKTKEMEIRKNVSEFLERGKIEVYVTPSKGEESAAAKLNETVINEYSLQLKNLGLNTGDTLNAILRLPNVLQTEEQELADEDFKLFTDALRIALENVYNFRKQEGDALKVDFEKRIENIEHCQEEIEKIAPQRAENRREKLKSSLEQLNADLEVNQDRFEQEMIYYLEKFDITEEFIRLGNHTSFFREIMNNDDVSKGKKLNFIGQEIGREINTIGSKANDMHIQKFVVEMKDELEKIKEQLGNVL